MSESELAEVESSTTRTESDGQPETPAQAEPDTEPERAISLELTRPVESRGAKRQPLPKARSANLGDRVLDAVTGTAASLIVFAIVVMIGVLAWQSRDSIQQYSFGFLTSSTWDPIHNIYGAKSAILGTVYTSLLALLLAAPIGLLMAIFLTEISPRRLRYPLGFVIEMLAAVPSIVYGLWALVVLVPTVAKYVEPWFAARFGANNPLFSGPPFGLGYMTASLILAIMIVPTITAISRDVIRAVPNGQRDAMLALGATRLETTWKTVLPSARSGIVGAIILALGRAVGETMAVQMVIGNTLNFNISLFSTGTTLPAVIVTQFSEATGGLFRSSLVELALILLIVTIFLNAVARLLVWRVTRVTGA